MNARKRLVSLHENRPDADHFARFAVELAIGASGELPTEFCLFRAGENRTHDGRGAFLFDDLSTKSCETHHAERGLADYMVDYDHASLAFIATDPAESGKAAGWFKMAVRDGALWATDVSWTPKGAEKLRAREFRYFSPAADYETTPDGAKRITKLVNCALTNNPALAGIPPLVASTTPPAKPEKEQSMKSILVLLGLAESASESEAATALAKINEALRSLVTLSGKASPAEALGVFTGWKAAVEQSAKLSAKIAELEAASASRELEELIKTGKTEGKLPPALEPWARSVGTVALKAFLEAAPKIGDSEKHEKPTGDQTVTLSATEIEGCKKTGLDPKKYAEHKAKSLAQHAAQ